MSNKTNRRGHWPKGKTRNDPAVPEGWRSIKHLLTTINKHLAKHRSPGGEHIAIEDSITTCAETLGIARSTLRGYLTGRSAPTTIAALRLSNWYHTRRDKHT